MMYQDAQQELKRLEDALLEEEPQPKEDDLSEWNIDDALSDIPDFSAPAKTSALNGFLTWIIIALTAGIVGVVIFWLIRYGGAFL